jgi:glycerol-3-phosphate acyltransferase PlsY
MHPAFGLLLGYVLGSIPFAYIAGKVARGIDLRQHGSGNLGATNVYRTLGARVAAVVFVLDTLKGALPVLAVRQYAAGSNLELWAIAAGVAAIVGHAKPIFLLWKGGGKGVATAGGVFLALAPIPALASMATFIVVVLLTGYVSVASLTAAVVLPVALAATSGVRSPLFIVSVVIAVFVFWTHRANIGRLRRGEEHRFGRKARA